MVVGRGGGRRRVRVRVEFPAHARERAACCCRKGSVLRLTYPIRYFSRSGVVTRRTAKQRAKGRDRPVRSIQHVPRGVPRKFRGSASQAICSVSGGQEAGG